MESADEIFGKTLAETLPLGRGVRVIARGKLTPLLGE